MELKETAQQSVKEEIVIVLDQLVEAQETGNIHLFEQCFLQDDNLVNIGTDMDEYWIGWKNFISSMQDMIKSRQGYKIYTQDTKIGISDDNNTAWYSQMMDTCMETKGDPFRLEGFRHTGVLKKTENGWKIIQSHVSIPFNYLNEKEKQES